MKEGSATRLKGHSNNCQWICIDLAGEALINHCIKLRSEIRVCWKLEAGRALTRGLSTSFYDFTPFPQTVKTRQLDNTIAKLKTHGSMTRATINRTKKIGQNNFQSSNSTGS